jgi:hypothetical protein
MISITAKLSNELGRHVYAIGYEAQVNALRLFFADVVCQADPMRTLLPC